MTIPGFFTPAWDPTWTGALISHLWQSTAIALLAWLLTIALRSNAARVRYAIWLAASIKFLVPFSLMTRIGAYWARPAADSRAGQVFYSMIEEFSLPFSQTPTPVSLVAPVQHTTQTLPIVLGIVASVWLFGSIVLLAKWISGWRHAKGITQTAIPVHEGREFDALRCAERRARLHKPIPLLLSASEIEPGIFGAVQPVLLWPNGLSERLDDVQIEAIMAHEVEHVCRRDNLTATIHALVEAVFWFHPLVRWMSTKMDVERERACDEKVIEHNARPEAYAESILKVCAFCLEPPTSCISGVSGADLKGRILRIMSRRCGTALSLWRKVVLASAAILILAAPVGFGMVHGQASATGTAQTPTVVGDLPKYDVASIKPNKTGDVRVRFMMTPDGISLQGAPMRMLLPQAFGVEEDRILGEPDWVKSSRYDIEAKVEPENAAKLKDLKAYQRNAMMLQLLVDRFNLKYHHEQRELPMYAMVVAKGGVKMKPTTPDQDAPEADAPPPGNGPQPRMGRHMLMMNPGHLESTGTSTEQLAHLLSRQLSRTVVDKTGLLGEYDFKLDYTPDNMPMPAHGEAEGGPKPQTAMDQGGPSIFTAVEEELGLKLEATKGMVDVIVIDHIDLPSEN